MDDIEEAVGLHEQLGKAAGHGHGEVVAALGQRGGRGARRAAREDGGRRDDRATGKGSEAVRVAGAASDRRELLSRVCVLCGGGGVGG